MALLGTGYQLSLVFCQVFITILGDL